MDLAEVAPQTGESLPGIFTEKRELEVLFIDANAYLEFFSSSKPQVKKLLPSIESLKAEIFVTEQVVSEVTRNKVKVAADSLREYLVAHKVPGVRLPEHLEGDREASLTEWNKKASRLSEEIKESNKNLLAVANDLLQKIMRGSDEASMVLEKIFALRAGPTAQEIERAKIRKVLGNPPGKSEDPLGDQVSWEQVLSRFEGSKPLWIISKDNDYSIQLGGKRYLNSFLWRELQAKSKNEIEVYIFDTIAEGLEAYSNRRKDPVEHLPSGDELKSISEQELEKNYLAYLSMGPSGPNVCVVCGQSKGFKGPVPKPSMYGGWSYQWLCNGCRRWNDFGEPYEC